MPASSLARLARKACERNLHMITDLGDAPYSIVKPLLKLMDPHQLYELEKISPQLIGHDTEIWKFFIKRDIMHSDKMDVAPEDPLEWYGIYQALLDAQEERLANADAALRNLRFNAEAEKNKHAARMVEVSAVKPPAGSALYKETIRMNRNDRRHLREPVRGNFGQSEFRSKGAAKPTSDVAAKPKSKLTKIRQAAVQMNKVFKTTPNRPQTATTQTRITRAPASFLEQHRMQSPNVAKPTSPNGRPAESRKRRAEEIEPDDIDDFVAERKRLKARESPPPAPTQSIRSLADICKVNKAASTGPKNDGKPGVATPEPVRTPSLSPPASTSKKVLDQILQASRSDPGPRPVARPKRPPVDIFMKPKRKRVS